MSVEELAEVRRQLDEYLAKGWIKPNVSLYGAPIFFVRQKKWTLRMYIDFMMLNNQTKIDAYPIPWIDKVLDCLCKTRVSSKIDLSKAYYQVAVEPSHMQKTVFFIKYKLFKFLVLPFGLVNVTATF